jgi:glycosyltransferase involved in cell wall biosynthesis
MPSLYRTADVFCLASWWEAFPLSLLEAMASGLPVVATRVGDVPVAVRDGETGLLVGPRDPAALAVALERLLADAEVRRAMGKAGRQRAVREFGARRGVQALGALYGELTGVTTPASPAGRRSPGGRSQPEHGFAEEGPDPREDASVKRLTEPNE